LSSLSPGARLGLQNDVFALAKAGRIPITSVMELASHYDKEENYFVVSTLSSNLHSMGRIHAHQPYYPNFQRFVRSLFNHAHEKLGWQSKPGDDHITSQFRSTVISTLAWADDPNVIKEGNKRLDEYVQKKVPIQPDIRASVYGIVAKHGSLESWNHLLSIFNTTDLSEEKVRVLDSLGRSHNEDIIRQILELFEKVRSQDAIYCFTGLSTHHPGRQAVWMYLKKNYASFLARFSQMGFLLGRILSTSLSGFVEVDVAQEIEEFFKNNQCPGAERTIKQCVETIRFNAVRLGREKEALAKWLQ